MNVTEYDRILVVTATAPTGSWRRPERCWCPAAPALPVFDPEKGEHFVLVYRDGTASPGASGCTSSGSSPTRPTTWCAAARTGSTTCRGRARGASCGCASCLPSARGSRRPTSTPARYAPAASPRAGPASTPRPSLRSRHCERALGSRRSGGVGPAAVVLAAGRRPGRSGQAAARGPRPA